MSTQPLPLARDAGHAGDTSDRLRALAVFAGLLAESGVIEIDVVPPNGTDAKHITLHARETALPQVLLDLPSGTCLRARDRRGVTEYILNARGVPELRK